MAQFNIDSFHRAVEQKGLQKPNKFLALITPPIPMIGNFLVNDYRSTSSMRGESMNGIDQSQAIQFWAEAGPIPGILSVALDVNRYGYGTTEKKPVRAQFNDTMFVFLADARADNWRFFHKWFSLVINHDMSDGDVLPKKAWHLDQAQSPYEVSYKQDYTGFISIHTFDDAGNESLNVTLRNVWPIFMGDITMNWAENNQIMRIPVTFTFDDWFINGVAPLTQESRKAYHAEGRPLPTRGGSFSEPTASAPPIPSGAITKGGSFPGIL